jgi:OmpA-OmpF porin, OOP family
MDMRNSITAIFVCLWASLLLSISGISMADAMPGTDPVKNFIFYVDISGSMSHGYPDEKKDPSKIITAVKLLHAINDEMPDMAANFGVYTFGPHQEYRRITPFDRDALAETFNQIPTDLTFSGRLTPMSDGILNLDTYIAALPGPVTFIVIADGESNVPPPPADVIQDAYDRYGDRVCFHFISFAQKPPEKAFMKSLSDINDCSVSVEAANLLDASVRADFIEKVFK